MSSNTSLQRLLLYGGASLGVAVGVERLAGFVSASVAARIAGPQTFGAYSVALATAGTIAAYAGAGIGTTANRFSGEYPETSSEYAGFLRALTLVALLSALVAAALMLGASVPLARWVIRNDALASVFKLAALSSGAMVLLECLRGLLIGQKKYYALLLVSVVSGAGIVIALPLMARIGATAMIGAQALVSLVVASGVFLFRKKLGIASKKEGAKAKGPGMLPILKFGLVQLSAFAGISIATWVIASLVARSDPSLRQIGFYGISNQLRGLAVVAPGLLAQVVYSLLTSESSEPYGGADRVVLSTTVLTTLLVTAVAGALIIAAPWAVTAIYGGPYGAAEVAVVLLLATAIIHMSNQSAAQRLSIVHLKATGLINAFWSVLLIGIGLLLIPRAAAAGAAAAFLLAHTVSSILVTASLYRRKALPSSYAALAAIIITATFTLAGLAYVRAVNPGHPLSTTLLLATVWLGLMLGVFIWGSRLGCIPSITFKRKAKGQPVPTLSET